jgi:hypothetical protein
VRDGRRHRIPVRAARRMPPKRCRIICIGGPIATPIRTRPGSGCRASGSPPREVPQDQQQSRPPALRGGTCQRGIPGSIGPHHGYRAARRVERRASQVVQQRGRARSGRPASTAGLSSTGKYLRRRGSARRRRRRGSRASAVGPGRRLRRDRGPPRRGSGSRCEPSHGRAPRRAHPIGTQQGLQRHRSSPPGRSSGADPLGAPRICRKRSAHGTAGGRGRDHHQPDPMIPRAEQRHRAGAADNG